jgi:hypothetical protein
MKRMHLTRGLLAAAALSALPRGPAAAQGE